MSQLAWHCFRCVMDSYCRVFNSPLGIIIILFAATLCFYHHICDWNYIIFLIPFYWRKHLTELSFDVSLWVWHNLLNYKRRSRHIQERIILYYRSLKSYHLLCWLYSLLVNTITILMVVDYTYEFIHGMIILHLTYWTFAQMDVAFAEILCNNSRSCKWHVIFQRIRLLGKRFPRTYS